jgi:hypothetical protein
LYTSEVWGNKFWNVYKKRMSDFSSTVLQFKIESIFLFNLFISAADSSTLFSIVFQLIFYSTLFWTKLIGITVISNIVTTVFTNPFFIHKVG